MRRISMLAGVVLAALTIGIATAPVAAADKGVAPVLECVFADAGAGSYVAVFGYENTAKSAQEIPISVDANRFDPAPIDRGQPTSFAAGRQTNVFTVTWDGTDLTWKVSGNGTAVTASRSSKACENPPVPQGSDSPQAFAMIAAAAGVIVVGGATSGWMVRRRRHRAI